MLLAIKIILVVVAVLAVLVCSVVLWFLKTISKAVKSATAAAVAGGTPQPCRVTLEPESNPQWRKSEIVTGYIEQLRAIGFEDIGAFRIPEMRNLMIFGLFHPGEGLVGVVYDHNKAPAPTFDICADFTDGSTLTATNSSSGDILDKRPNHPILWLGNDSAQQVLEAVQKFSAPAPRQPILKENFVERFKKAYARSINWRLKKGGASRDEIRRSAEKKGLQFTDEQIEESYQRLHQTYLLQLQLGCIAQYADDQKPDAAEWENIRSQVFAIAETLSLDEIIETIDGHLDLEEEQREQLKKVSKNSDEDGTVVIGKILVQNIANLDLKKLGEVTEPVRAIILLAEEKTQPAKLPETIVK